MNLKKLLSLSIGIIISISVQSSFANPNICSGNEFTNELEEIQFERCPNGFKFATFNRYANVNLFGAAGTQSNKLESEKDYFLSMRKYIPVAERDPKNQNLKYETFQNTTDPNHANFKHYLEFHTQELAEDDIVEFQIFLHNNGNPRCNTNKDLCNKFTYAVDPVLEIFSNFNESDNTFNALDLTLSYERPRSDDSTSSQSHQRAAINNLLSRNQKLKLLTGEDLTNSQADVYENGNNVLTTGMDISFCQEFESNQIDCKTFSRARESQAILTESLKNHININRAADLVEHDENIFLASSGYALKFTFFKFKVWSVFVGIDL